MRIPKSVRPRDFCLIRVVAMVLFIFRAALFIFQILTLAVLAIVICAPIGSLLIALLGPRLLHKTVQQSEPIKDAGSVEKQDGEAGNGENNVGAKEKVAD